MDIYDYLKLDHERVNQLFKQFENTENKERQAQIVALLSRELLVHAKSEEKTLYKVLEHYYESQHEAFHGEKEHDEIKEQVSLILSTKKIDEFWIEQVKQLKKLVTHHVNEEEGNIFKKAKKVISDTEAYHLKEQMHYLKQTYLRQLEKNESKEFF